MAENAIMVSTETDVGRRELRAARIACWLAGIFFIAGAVFLGFAPDTCFSSPRGVWDRIMPTILCGGLGMGMFVTPRFTMRGTWRLDDNGISFSPLRGMPQSMDWRNVDGIFSQCMKIRIVFREGSRKIPLVLQWESKERKEETLEFLKTKLGLYFDIFSRVPAKTSIRRLLWVAVVASSLTIAYFAPLLMPSVNVYLLQCEHAREWILAWMLIPAVLFCVWSMFFSWREYKKHWSLRRLETNPTVG